MIEDKFVTLAYGNGGVFMRALIEKIFARHLANPQLDVTADAVYVPMQPGEVMITTDGFTVHPLEFPGEILVRLPYMERSTIWRSPAQPRSI